MAGELGRPEPKASQGNPEPGPEKDEIRTREWNIHNLSFFGGNLILPTKAKSCSDSLQGNQEKSFRNKQKYFLKILKSQHIPFCIFNDELLGTPNYCFFLKKKH